MTQRTFSQLATAGSYSILWYLAHKFDVFYKQFRSNQLKPQGVFIVTEEEFEAKKSFLGWSAIKLWLKSLISCCQTSCHGVASSSCELWKCSLSHNLVKSAWILEIFGSRCIRKKRGIFLWSLFCRWTEKNPSDSMKCEKMSLRKSRSTIFNQLLLKIDSRFPPLARPHWKEENQGFLTVYGMPMDNFFTKNPFIGKLCSSYDIPRSNFNNKILIPTLSNVLAYLELVPSWECRTSFLINVWLNLTCKIN